MLSVRQYCMFKCLCKRKVEQHFMYLHVNTHEIKAVHAIINLSHQTELQKGINPHFQKSVLFIIFSSNVCSGLWMFESADVFLFSLQMALRPVHGPALKSLKQSQHRSQLLSISLYFVFIVWRECVHTEHAVQHCDAMAYVSTEQGRGI